MALRLGFSPALTIPPAGPGFGQASSANDAGGVMLCCSSRVEFPDRVRYGLGLRSNEKLEFGDGGCGRLVARRKAFPRRLNVARSANVVSESENRVGSLEADVTGSGEVEVKVEETQNQSGDAETRAEENVEDEELEMGYKMSRVCDRLIEVFMIEKKTPVEWRKLLAFSEEWTRIRPHFYKRCKTNAKAEEDPKRRGDLLKLARKLKEVDDDMLRHDDLLAEIEKTPLNLDIIVAKRRKDFTSDFFEHLHTLCDASYRNLNRRDEIAAIAGRCLSAVEAYDAAQEDDEYLAEAQLKFDDILNSPSLEAAANKIDKLAQRQELDSTLMLLITKAWAAAKESTMMKEEVKDIMFHLYNVARGNMQRLVPSEVRIIRHLLAIPDPRERFAAMTDAFSPGDELEGKNKDTLYTTPENLHKWVKIILDAYHTNKRGTLIKEARNLMNPEVISRLEVLKEVLEDQFM
ncbi:hypothetical protein MPTK1_6g13740 [Marchantia polymorpha subsp. ruderalis]|uniref:Uncharacterized protein n=2 Tax=Marchantia polymorpha TaxID=3197 RepID=A0A176W5A5_MARPO|nr:hypothetical protein AXG93_2015s1130 [Marchantia polymorpha subsp. ruderalis]PTQ39041.1 hypothetical protein MARPO_0047s0025 [Marchantia polymorpha]BBN14703.1 hypothetical protein Mp_6g13740 [Marchantia polymorpha subsp. ruderalis]|eukprot:PTQ39041.1 hypothetical protein MARPO_0047s0025 [Marchantia polymorpha]